MAGYNYGPTDPDLIKRQQEVANVVRTMLELPLDQIPTDPDLIRRQQEVANVVRTVLEKRRVATVAPIPVQVLHDVEISFIEDYMTDTVLMKLESFVFEEKVSHGMKTVPFYKTEWVHMPSMIPTAVFMGILFALSVFAYIMSASPWVYLLIVGVAFAGVLFNLFYLPKQRAVTVSGEVEFHVDTLIRFPENKKIYPPDLGRPYKAIEVRTYTQYDDGRDDLEDE